MTHPRSKIFNTSVEIPRNASKYLRLNQSQLDIHQFLKDDAENEFIHHDANEIHHYDLHYTLKKINKNQNINDIPFNSVHKLPEGRAKRFMVAMYKKPEKGNIEKEIKQKIEKIHGKLLSEINDEFDNEIVDFSSEEPHSDIKKTKLPPILNSRIQPQLNVIETDEKYVENLDHWLAEKVKRQKVVKKGNNLFSNSKINILNSPSKFESPPLNQPSSSLLITQVGEESIELKQPKPSVYTFETAQKSEEYDNKSTFSSSNMVDPEGSSALSSLDNSGGLISQTKNSKNMLKALARSESKTSSGVGGVIKEMLESSANEESAMMQRVIFFEKKNKKIENKLSSLMKEITSSIDASQVKIYSLKGKIDEIGKKMSYLTRNIEIQAPKKGGKTPTAATSKTTKKTKSSSKKNQKETEDSTLSPEIREMKESLSSCKQDLKENENKIVIIEEEIQEKKKELKDVQVTKKKFLLEILEKGLDVRDQGLVWILKALMSDGIQATSEDLPVFLDTKSRAYLVSRSQMEVRLAELRSLKQTILEIKRATDEQNPPEDKKTISELLFRTSQEPDEQELSNKKPYEAKKYKKKETFKTPVLNTNSPKKKGISDNPQNFDSKKLIWYEFETSKKLNQLDETLTLAVSNNSSFEKFEKKPFNHGEKSNDFEVINTSNNEETKSSFVVLPSIKKDTSLQIENRNPMTNYTNSASKLTLQRASIAIPNTKSITGGLDIKEEKLADLYYSLSVMPKKKKMFTQNEQIYQNTRGALFKLIENYDKKLQQNDLDTVDRSEEEFKIYDGTKLLNDYEGRVQFIRKIEAIQQEIYALSNAIKQEEKAEIERIISEFQFKNYKKRMNTDENTVFPALFGGHRAEKILSQNGFIIINFDGKAV